MQTFLYWANVSVHANKDYQVQFPPHTEFGTSHSKTQYTDWPVTRVGGEDNLDTSWRKNWKGSNSTFAVNYTDGFLSGYDYGADAGTIHNQFVDAHLLNGLDLLRKKQAAKALDDFLAAGTFPKNLETNELSTGPVVSKVAYHQGLAYKALGRTDDATAAFERCIAASSGTGRMLNDQAMQASKYYIVLSYRELGKKDQADSVLAEMQQFVDKQLAKKGSTVVDIYSKFGEDGSSDAIKATNFYIRGLIHLANADTHSAGEAFTNSLKLNPSDIWAKYYYLSACK